MTLLSSARQQQLQALVQKLDLLDSSPIQWELLDRALTHPTVSSTDNYEQLEFLGDAVVRLAAAEFLLTRYPHLPVGEFTAIRSILVSDRVLARIGSSYHLERYLLVGGSAVNDALGRGSRLAQSLEAILGVLYLSTQSLSLIRPWLDPHFEQLVPEIYNDPARQNYKAALQEWSQGQYKQLPKYQVTESKATARGEDRFVAEVWLQGKCLGQGRGRSIKAAEQAAAQVACAGIFQAPPPH